MLRTAALPNVTRTRRLSHRVAFTAITAVFVIFMAASSAPSPLYVVYQEAWGFSATTLTIVFAVYVFALLASLLVVGALSDHIGRRPVLAGAVVVEAVALLLFIVAGDVYVLSAARIAQGLATGAALSTLGATLVDLDPPERQGRAGMITSVAPTAGLAIGALGCGFLVQYGPAPTHLVYELLLAAVLLSGIVIALIPETVSPREGALASLKPSVGIPAHLRAPVFALVPILIASWALGGLYLSLGPSVAATVFEVKSHLVGGLVVSLLCGTGAVTSYFARGRSASQLLIAAATILAVGMAITLVGIESESALLAGIGTLIAGVGFGASALAAFGTLARIAAPHERGELFSVAFVVSYLAFSLPALIAGLSAERWGLRDTAIVYGLFVVVVSLAALAAQRAITARERIPAA